MTKALDVKHTRFIHLINILLILLSLIGKSAWANSPSITIAFGHSNYDFLPIFQKFTEETGITINSAPIERYDLKLELVRQKTKKVLPDVVFAPADYVGIESIEFSIIPNDWLSSDIEASNLAAVSRDNLTLAIPIIAGNHLLMYYNKSMVEEPVKSWKEMEALAHTRQSPPIAWYFNSMYNFIPFLGAFNGLPLKDGRIDLDTPEMEAALTYYWDLQKKGVVSDECHVSCISNGFASKEFPYIIDGVWAYQSKLADLGEDLGIAPLPVIDGRSLVPYFSVHALAFPNNSLVGEKREILKKFSLFLQSEWTQWQIWELYKALPVSSKAMSRIMAQPNEHTKTIIQQLKSAQPMPIDPEMAIVWAAMSKGFVRYGAEIIDAKEAASLMEHLAQRSVKRGPL